MRWNKSTIVRSIVLAFDSGGIYLIITGTFFLQRAFSQLTVSRGHAQMQLHTGTWTKKIEATLPKKKKERKIPSSATDQTGLDDIHSLVNQAEPWFWWRRLNVYSDFDTPHVHDCRISVCFCHNSSIIWISSNSVFKMVGSFGWSFGVTSTLTFL